MPDEEVATSVSPGWYIVYRADGSPYECAWFWHGHWYFADHVPHQGSLPPGMVLGESVDSLLARPRKKRVKRAKRAPASQGSSP